MKINFITESNKVIALLLYLTLIRPMFCTLELGLSQMKIKGIKNKQKTTQERTIRSTTGAAATEVPRGHASPHIFGKKIFFAM